MIGDYIGTAFVSFPQMMTRSQTVTIVSQLESQVLL